MGLPTNVFRGKTVPTAFRAGRPGGPWRLLVLALTAVGPQALIEHTANYTALPNEAVVTSLHVVKRISRAEMKIATFNINNVNRRLPNLLNWLKSSKPDIVCLQELKCTDAEFPAAAIQKAGYHAVWHGQKPWN